jgi:hypothetical protein
MRKDVFPNRQTDIIITGYQRSGNTFSKVLLEQLFPELRFITHIHTLAILKKGRKLGIPILILIRDPKEAIASSIVKLQSDPRSMPIRKKKCTNILEYISFYKYVIHNTESFVIVEFDIIKQAPAKLVNIVCENLRIQNSYTEEQIRQTVEEVKDRLKSDTRKAAEQMFESDEKNAYKANILSEIENSKMFIKAQQIYNLLCDRAKS